MADNSKVGVIGNGVMGSAIAARLLEQRVEVFVRDQDPAKMQNLTDKGAIATTSSANLTECVDVVITSLNTADIVEAVVFGKQGVAEAASSKKLLIDMSSTDPKATAIMAERLLSETGMAWVDAPLSGGAPAALVGKLTLMIGGTGDAVDRAKAVLSHVAANMTHMGGNGAGQTTKLINQVLCAANFLSVAEATRLALDGAVDAAKIPAALEGGRADSRILQEFMPKMANYDYTPTGRIDNMLKDLEAVQNYATAMRTPMPLTGMITELHRMMVMAGIGPEDSAAYMKLFDFGRGPSVDGGS
ncbi:MAG: NAD(P)-dependent oxidoreductase [Geminicoccales bacterium]